MLQTTDSKVMKLHSLSKYLYIKLYLNVKLNHSVNGSNVWGSLAPYGDEYSIQMEYLRRQGVFSF